VGAGNHLPNRAGCFGDQGYTGEDSEYAAAIHDIDLQIITRPEGQTGFILLPRRWVVERSFA